MVEWSKTSDSGSDLRNGARVRIPILSIIFCLWKTVSSGMCTFTKLILYYSSSGRQERQKTENTWLFTALRLRVSLGRGVGV